MKHGMLHLGHCTRTDVRIHFLSTQCFPVLLLHVSNMVNIAVVVNDIASGVDTYLHTFLSAELLSLCHVMR